MGGILDKLDEWLRGLLTEGITGNLSGMFDTVNTKVGEIAGEVGQTPQAWNSGVFSMIRNLSETVIVPIAGVILTFVMCYELIQLVAEKNNMHDVDTWMFFKWIFKTFCAVLIVTNTWNIVMAVFDVGQSVVNQSAGVIIGETAIDIDSVITDMEAQLEALSTGGEKPDMSRDDLAAVAEAVAALSPEDQSLLAAVQASPYRLTTAEQFREFPDNIDFFVLEPQVKQMEDLGWRYLEQHLDLELSPALRAAIDPVPFGRQAMEEDRGCFTKYGYLSLSGDEWQHEQTVEHGWRETEKKPSIRERLEQSKKECAGKDRAQPVKDKSAPEL